MRITLTPGISRHQHAHQAGIEILQITFRYAIFDQNHFRQFPFVINIQGTATAQGTIVVTGMTPAGTFSPIRLEKGRTPAIEVTFGPWPITSCSRIPSQPEPSTTVISPAGARFCGRIDYGLMYGLLRVIAQHFIGK